MSIIVVGGSGGKPSLSQVTASDCFETLAHVTVTLYCDVFGWFVFLSACLTNSWKGHHGIKVTTSVYLPGTGFHVSCTV